MSDFHPVRYEAMVSAIDACHRIDEVKSLHDKARAMEVYAAQAMNTEAERKACEIRIRAERRAGELMLELRRNKSSGVPATVAGTSEYAQALESAGVKERTAQRWQNLAAVPKEQFEAALSGEEKPATRAIIKKANGANGAMSPDALWFWGRLRDIERMELWKWTPDDLLGEMTDTMVADVGRVLPLVKEWIEGFK